MKLLYQFSVQHHLQYAIRDVPGRPLPNAPECRLATIISGKFWFSLKLGDLKQGESKIALWSKTTSADDQI